MAIALLVAASIATGCNAPLASQTASSPTAAPGSVLPSETGASETYPDGIPTSIGGKQVVRAGDVGTIDRLAMTGQPFLIGGWTSGPLLISCPTVVPAPSLAPSCLSGAQTLGDTATDPGLWSRLVNLAGVAVPEKGRVVLRVHGHDPEAERCPPFIDRCWSALVIDAVAWTP